VRAFCFDPLSEPRLSNNPRIWHVRRNVGSETLLVLRTPAHRRTASQH